MTESLTREEPGSVDPHVIMHDHMISNIVQIGRIVEPQEGDPQQPAGGASVLVHIGGEEKGTYTRNWLPWLAARSGYDAEWWMPEIDEQVVAVAPSGNLALAVIIGTLYRGKWMGFAEQNDFSKPPTAENQIPVTEQAHIHRRIYKDGSIIQYDRGKHVFECRITDTSASEAAALCLHASLDQGQGKLHLSLGRENDEEKQTRVELEAGKVSITAPNKITLAVGKSRFVLDGSEAVLAVGEEGAGTKMTVSEKHVDVV